MCYCCFQFHPGQWRFVAQLLDRAIGDHMRAAQRRDPSYCATPTSVFLPSPNDLSRALEFARASMEQQQAPNMQNPEDIARMCEAFLRWKQQQQQQQQQSPTAQQDQQYSQQQSQPVQQYQQSQLTEQQPQSYPQQQSYSQQQSDPLDPTSQQSQSYDSHSTFSTFANGDVDEEGEEAGDIDDAADDDAMSTESDADDTGDLSSSAQSPVFNSPWQRERAIRDRQQQRRDPFEGWRIRHADEQMQRSQLEQARMRRLRPRQPQQQWQQAQQPQQTRASTLQPAWSLDSTDQQPNRRRGSQQLRRDSGRSYGESSADQQWQPQPQPPVSQPEQQSPYPLSQYLQPPSSASSPSRGPVSPPELRVKRYEFSIFAQRQWIGTVLNWLIPSAITTAEMPFALSAPTMLADPLFVNRDQRANATATNATVSSNATQPAANQPDRPIAQQKLTQQQQPQSSPQGWGASSSTSSSYPADSSRSSSEIDLLTARYWSVSSSELRTPYNSTADLLSGVTSHTPQRMILRTTELGIYRISGQSTHAQTSTQRSERAWRRMPTVAVGRPAGLAAPSSVSICSPLRRRVLGVPHFHPARCCVVFSLVWSLLRFFFRRS